MVAHGSGEREVLRALADLCGRLLLREANSADLELMHRREVRGAFESLGVSVPDGPPHAVLEELARQYHASFLAPESGAPPVASLWRAAHLGSDTVAAARSAVAAAGLEVDGAHGPHDHLGRLLCLWARADETAPEVAELLRDRHLAWGIDALQSRALGDDAGFYPSLARATIAVLVELTGSGREF
ncbi:MAG TPA: molecular chaperone TorD family protein [Planctomycetota bacterium]|nr:molecular chaperone TorD family protein [Planctomycetota bacterium]